MKTCKHCGRTNDQVEFYPRRNACRKCYLKHHREWMRRRRALSVNPKATCAICGAKENLVVDHCHDGGHIRGILCNSCNVALGYMNDDPARLRAAATYLDAERDNGKPEDPGA